MMTKSQVVAHLADKPGIEKKAAAADADEVFATLAKVFSRL